MFQLNAPALVATQFLEIPDNYWEAGEEARFIETLGNPKSHKIDEAVKDILVKITDEDYLAIACMRHLMGRGYESEIRDYCRRRIPVSKNYTKELQQIITQLDESKPE